MKAAWPSADCGEDLGGSWAPEPLVLRQPNGPPRWPAGALRVLTHPAIFDPPADTGDVLDVLDEFVGQDNVHVLSIPAGHWGVVSDLCRQVRAKGNVVHDAAHAALAIQHGATWISKDRGFARFRGLTWRLPE